MCGGSLEAAQRNYVLFIEYGCEQPKCMPYSSISGNEFKHVTQAPLVASYINVSLGCNGWLQACGCEGCNFCHSVHPYPFTSHPTYHTSNALDLSSSMTRQVLKSSIGHHFASIEAIHLGKPNGIIIFLT